MTEKVRIEVFFELNDGERIEKIVKVLGEEEETPRFKVRLYPDKHGIKAEIEAKDVVGARTAINALLRNYKIICDLKDL